MMGLPQLDKEALHLFLVDSGDPILTPAFQRPCLFSPAQPLNGCSQRTSSLFLAESGALMPSSSPVPSVETPHSSRFLVKCPLSQKLPFPDQLIQNSSVFFLPVTLFLACYLHLKYIYSFICSPLKGISCESKGFVSFAYCVILAPVTAWGL